MLPSYRARIFAEMKINLADVWGPLGAYLYPKCLDKFLWDKVSFGFS